MPFVIQINTRETETLEKPIQLVDFFTRVLVRLKYDSVCSDFQFEYEFDANKRDHTEIAGVSHYHEAIISYRYPDGKEEKVLTGFVLSQNFVDSPQKEILPIGGYSKPGLLEDCDVPTFIPLEYDGLKLSDIIRNICNAFNLEVSIKARSANESVYSAKSKDTSNSTNNEFPPLSFQSKSEADRADEEIGDTTKETSENAASYLKKLCLQKNIILTHDALGRVVVKTANTESQPVLTFDADTSPRIGYERMSLNYNGQGMFREITVVRQADDEGGQSSKATAKNPFCPVSAVPRYKVEIQTSGDDISVEEAAKNALSKSLKDIVLTVVIDTLTASTSLILPDNTIFVKNKKLNLFKMTKFFIESVDIEQTPERTTQTLTCVLPWVYNYNSKSADGKKTGPYNVFIEPGQNFPTA